MEAIKKTAAFFLGVVMIFALTGAAYEPTDRYYVNDFADVLSEDNEDVIYKTSHKLRDEQGVSIVVVTVPDMVGAEKKLCHGACKRLVYRRR